MFRDQPAPLGAAEIERDLQSSGGPPGISLHQAAALAGKSADQLARLARAGILRAARSASASGFGGHWRISRRALAEYLAGGGRP